MSQTPKVVSVNVGQIQEYTYRGRQVTSGIAKVPVAGPQQIVGIHIGADEQADMVGHGGEHKAVYAYAEEDYAWWSNELGRELEVGIFGENLTTSGIDVTNARVGDRWHIGTAILEVSEPRVPCYKLGMAVGEERFQRRFSKANRPGTYLRIVGEGVLEVGDSISAVPTTDASISIGEIGDIYAHDNARAGELLAVTAHLSEPWRRWAQQHTTEETTP